MQVFDDRFQAQSGWKCSSSLTVENSWWWAERLPETCRVLLQCIWIISTSFWLFKKKTRLLSI